MSEELREILEEHRGRESAITSDELADRMGWEDSNGNPKVRFALREMAERTGLPIGATSNGYYVIETRAELIDYIKDLKQRQKGIQDRIEIARENFDEEADPQATLDAVGEVES